MNEKFVGSLYELFGKPLGIHGELLGNSWGLLVGLPVADILEQSPVSFVHFWETPLGLVWNWPTTPMNNFGI